MSNFRNIEFYLNPDGELEYKIDNSLHIFAQEDTELIEYLYSKIENDYPAAFKALKEYYGNAALNVPYFRFLVTRRFCKCNFGRGDNTKADIDDDGDFNLEIPICPLRGECTYYKIICQPKRATKLTNREMQVLKMWADGKSKSQIAEELYISPMTVSEHIRSIYKKLNVNKMAQAIKMAAKL